MRRNRETDPSIHNAKAILHHRVQFFETDAMGIVHHANYVRYLEMARIEWMDLHDRPCPPHPEACEARLDPGRFPS